MIEKIKNCKRNITPIQLFIDNWKEDTYSINQKTSGSTGKPKTIEIPKWKMIASAKMTGSFFNLEGCSTALLCMSEEYIGGKMMIIRSLLYDLDLYIADVTRNPIASLDFHIDFVAMVPLQVEAVLNENPEKFNLIKYLIIGGAPVSEKLIKKLAHFNCQFYATFGMTETVSQIALKNLSASNEYYKAIGSTTFSTQNNRLVIQCEELGIENLLTNDIVELNSSTSFKWIGRSDFTINSGGIKIQPEVLEQEIQHLIHSSDFIISKQEDEEFGERVILIGEKKLIPLRIEKIIKKHIVNYQQPKTYYYIEKLKRTSSGKVNRLLTTELIK